MRSLGQHAASGARSRLLVGTDWLVEGVLSVEAGIDVVLASETAPVPRFAQAIGARKSELNRAGVTFESAENDIVLAGLLRAGMLAGRRTVAMFEMRGFRTALDMLHEAAQIPVRSTGGGVAVLCEPRWRLWPLADLPGPGTAVEPARSGPGNRSRAAVAGRSSGKPSGGATGVGSVREGAEAAARRVSEIIQRGALGSRSSAAGTASDVSPTGGGPGPDASSPPTFALTADRLPWADPRDLASYLGVPMLEPATPEEIRPYLNEAFRLSRASQRMVILWLPPSLIAGGATTHVVPDPAIRPIARSLDHRGDDGDTADPLHREARLRQLDRVANTPGPGETVPLAFITIGTAFQSLRHALNLLDLTGRVPILKLAYSNPIDPRSVEQVLARSQRVVVVEPGRPIVERKVLAIAQAMRLSGQPAAEVFGRWLPTSAEAPTDRDHTPATPTEASHRDRLLSEGKPRPMLNRPHQGRGGYIAELHPSELVEHLGPLLQRLLPGLAGRVRERVLEQRHAVKALHAHWPDLSRPLADLQGGAREREPWRRRQDLIHAILQHAIRTLTHELAEPTATRPSLRLRAETIDDTGLDPSPDERVLVTLERRRLPAVGQAAITHALRRRLNVTFLIEPDPPVDSGPTISVTEAETIVRSLVATTVTGRPMVAVVDPSDGLVLQGTLRRAVSGSRLAVVIVDGGNVARRQNVAGDPEEWTRLGFVPREVRIRPTSSVPGLAHEWLVRRGWNAVTDLDGVHGPRLELPEPNDPRATPLDGWEGFEEFRIYREQPAPEAAAWLQGLFVVDPTPMHGSQPHWRVHVAGPLGRAFDRALKVLELAGQRMGYRVQLVHGRDAGGAFGQIVFTRPRPNEPPPPVTARIPHGMADLVIALAPESLFSALDPVHGHAVASPARTHLVLDLSGGVDIANDSGWGRSRQFVVPGALNRVIPPAQRVVLRAGEVCDRLLHGRSMLGAMLVGLAFQRGWIPVSADGLNRAAHRLPDDPLDHATQAIRIGRAMAQWPDGRGAGVRTPAPSGLISTTVASLPGGGSEFSRSGPTIAAIDETVNQPASRSSFVARATSRLTPALEAGLTGPLPVGTGTAAPTASVTEEAGAVARINNPSAPPEDAEAPASSPAADADTPAADVSDRVSTTHDPTGTGTAAIVAPRDALTPPTSERRALRSRHTPHASGEPEAMVRRHRLILSRQWGWKRKRYARRFEEIALGTLDAITGLRRRDPARIAEVRFVARLIDCERWGGLRYARAYADRVREVYAAERAVNDYMVTRLAITELGRAMLVPDAVFVAATMLRPDRRREVCRQLRVNRLSGDVLTVQVQCRLRRLAGLPGVGAASAWSFGPITASVISRVPFVRYLPWWEERNLAYRDWVMRLVDRCVTELPERASVWIEVFRQLERVRGSGWQRFDAMRRVRIAVGSLLELSGGPEPPPSPEA